MAKELREHGGQKVFASDFNFTAKQIGREEDRTLSFIGTTSHKDRDGDVIEAGGWDVKNYKKNPVFLWGHNYGGAPAIGRTLRLIRDDNKMEFQVKFAEPGKDYTDWPSDMPTPDTVWRLYRGGFLSATSVGFIPIEWEWIEEGKGDDKRITGRRYKSQELLELSAVNVPANPAALQNALNDGVIPPEAAATLSKAFGVKLVPPAYRHVLAGYDLPFEGIINTDDDAPSSREIFEFDRVPIGRARKSLSRNAVGDYLELAFRGFEPAFRGFEPAASDGMQTAIHMTKKLIDEVGLVERIAAISARR